MVPLVLAGCWKDQYSEIPADVLRFQPPVEAPLDWLLAPIDVNLKCPDGTNTRFYLLYPESSAADGTPLPAAVLYHSGSFDFVDNFGSCFACAFCPGGSAPKERTRDLSIKYTAAYFLYSLLGQADALDYINGTEFQKDAMAGDVSQVEK